MLEPGELVRSAISATRGHFHGINVTLIMSLQPFPILLLMMNIAHLLLQKETQKEDRAVGIPLLDDILCDNLICKGSVVYPCIGEDDTSSLC